MDPLTIARILGLLKRFWPVIPIVGLAVALWFSNEGRKTARADEATAKQYAATVTEANGRLAGALDTMKQMRVDNDAIATAVAVKLGVNTARAADTKAAIEKAVNDDPKARNWSGDAVPDSVRKALHRH